MLARLFHRPHTRLPIPRRSLYLPQLRRDASTWRTRFIPPIKTLRIPSLKAIRIPSIRDLRMPTTQQLQGTAYWTARISRYVILFFIGYHIFITHFFVYGPVYGISMLPTFNDEGDWVLTSSHYRRGRDVQVGDLITFTHPIKADTQSLKRVLGMPGDFVLRDTPGTSGAMQQVPEGHCWVAGDNQEWSRDSRMFGPLPLGLVKGKVVARKAAGEWLLRAIGEPWAELEVN
ncbi:hypothetical protein B0A48_01399 [Cryoendolithus antarcticus]|uniref:Peptidase S26 domain-containing protein n=1 Tax=Cryoendolithus antarcticus TaxID=1507870 RepID=A0A1V8TT76_9PEZI|nr:hypothetical protein B0A48_01399 [Cryoendolithus antarcticus]